MKTMSATIASKEFGRFIDAAQREPVLLTKKGRPVGSCRGGGGNWKAA